MNRMFFISAIGAIASASASVLLGQGQTRSPSVPDIARIVAIGCISRAPAGPAATAGRAAGRPTFILTDTRSEPPAVYRLDGNASDLEFHAGHLVEIRGTLTVAGRGSAPSGLKIASLTYLAPSCPGKTGR